MISCRPHPCVRYLRRTSVPSLERFPCWSAFWSLPWCSSTIVPYSSFTSTCSYYNCATCSWILVRPKCFYSASLWMWRLSDSVQEFSFAVLFPKSCLTHVTDWKTGENSAHTKWNSGDSLSASLWSTFMSWHCHGSDTRSGTSFAGASSSLNLTFCCPHQKPKTVRNRKDMLHSNPLATGADFPPSISAKHVYIWWSCLVARLSFKQWPTSGQAFAYAEYIWPSR